MLYGALSKLEPWAGKLARTVLRGLSDGDITQLPDQNRFSNILHHVVPISIKSISSSCPRLLLTKSKTMRRSYPTLHAHEPANLPYHRFDDVRRDELFAEAESGPGHEGE